MSCPKCKGEGFIIHTPKGPYSPDKTYTSDCPLLCEAQQRISKRKPFETLITSLGKNVHDRMHELVDEIERLKETLAAYEGGYGVLVPSAKLKEMQAQLAEAERVIEWYAGWDRSDKYVQAVPKAAHDYLAKYKK